MPKHPSHVTRFSDASSFDEVCVNCGATDEVPGGWGKLAKPCPKPPGAGGMTYEEWNRKEQEKVQKRGVARTKEHKVLVVDDMPFVHKKFRMSLGNKVILLEALTLKKGLSLFNANPDVSIIVMDACVPGDEPNSQWLVEEIRKTFTGPIIASSSSPVYRKKLLEVGCDYECDKGLVPRKVVELLGIS